MELTLRQDAIEETFADVEKLVYHTVHEFIRRYGGDFDEFVSHAGISFMTAWQTCDHRKGKLSTRLRWCIWKDLLTLRRNKAKHYQKVVFTDLDPEAYAAPRKFDKLAFLDELSEDARHVVTLVLEEPWQFDPDPRRIRTVLRYYLRRGLCWQPSRIKDCFTEIRNALSEGV